MVIHYRHQVHPMLDLASMRLFRPLKHPQVDKLTPQHRTQQPFNPTTTAVLPEPRESIVLRDEACSDTRLPPQLLLLPVMASLLTAEGYVTTRHTQVQSDTIAQPRSDHLPPIRERAAEPGYGVVRARHGRLSGMCAHHEHRGAEARCGVCWSGAVGTRKGQWEGTWEGQCMWSPSETVLDGHPTHACCFCRPWTCNWPGELRVFVMRENAW